MWLYEVMKVLVRVLLMPLFLVRRLNRGKIPAQGKVILVGNHVGMLDPLLMSSMSPRWMRFMAKREIFDKPILGWCARNIGAFPINRGEADLSGIRTALQVLKEEGVLVIFPEGTRNPHYGAPLLPLHDGVALLALKSGAPIVPFFVDGRYIPFSRIKLSVGDPIDLSDLNARKADKATMTECMARVRAALHSLGGITEHQGEQPAK
jgi:1-acyl-sn-glycerol-3-phosphate acyltransferase